ncbi:unnamed protein product, partial [Phaeothamnion confervicola]
VPATFRAAARAALVLVLAAYAVAVALGAPLRSGAAQTAASALLLAAAAGPHLGAAAAGRAPLRVCLQILGYCDGGSGDGSHFEGGKSAAAAGAGYGGSGRGSDGGGNPLGSFWASSEASAALPALGAGFGAWVGALVIPLDWNRPWQMWPLPLVAGGIAGMGVGTLLFFGASCLAALRHSKEPRSASAKRRGDRRAEAAAAGVIGGKCA